MFSIALVIVVIVIVDWAIRERRKDKTELGENNDTDNEDKPRPPYQSYTRSNWMELVIGDSNASKVAEFLFQFLNDIPYFIRREGYSINTKGGQYYSPETHDVISYTFVASGNKEIFKPIPGTNKSEVSVLDMSEMYFVDIVQGGQNKTLVKFHTNDKDVFEVFREIFQRELGKAFLIESKESSYKEPEITFPNLFVHDELTINKAAPEQIVDYIKNSISSTLWYLHIRDEIAYDVDQGQTKFYYPNKDNLSFYGIVFAGIKYDLESKGNGILNRKNGNKIPNLFTISISSAGLGNETKILLKFDTQIQDAEGFFYEWVIKELRKIFDVTEPEQKGSLNWSNINFTTWNPIMNNTTAKCGVEVINNSGDKISDCYVELVGLYDENDGEYIDTYAEIKSHLPCKLAWQIHNEFVYEKTEIESTDSRYLVTAEK